MHFPALLEVSKKYREIFTNYITRTHSIPDLTRFNSRRTLAMSKLSPLVETISVSKTIEIHALTKVIELSGESVYSLCVGEPDYEPPAEVVVATVSSRIQLHNLLLECRVVLASNMKNVQVEAVNQGHTKYTTVTGSLALRTAISQDLLARKGTAYSPEQIVVLGRRLLVLAEIMLN